MILDSDSRSWNGSETAPCPESIPAVAGGAAGLRVGEAAGGSSVRDRWLERRRHRGGPDPPAGRHPHTFMTALVERVCEDGSRRPLFLRDPTRADCPESARSPRSHGGPGERCPLPLPGAAWSPSTSSISTTSRPLTPTRSRPSPHSFPDPTMLIRLGGAALFEARRMLGSSPPPPRSGGPHERRESRSSPDHGPSGINAVSANRQRQQPSRGQGTDGSTRPDLSHPPESRTLRMPTVGIRPTAAVCSSLGFVPTLVPTPRPPPRTAARGDRPALRTQTPDAFRVG